jgi:hypothetical protein
LVAIPFAGDNDRAIDKKQENDFSSSRLLQVYEGI